MKEGRKIKLFIGETEVTSKELARHASSLIKNGEGEEMTLLSRAGFLIQNYHRHKDKQPLHDAVRNEPELFQLRMFREFVADLLTKDYRPIVGGTETKKKLKKNFHIRATVQYYKRMGIRVYYESNKPDAINCVLLASERLGVGEEVVKEALKKRNGNTPEEDKKPMGIENGLSSGEGHAIFVLNGFRAPRSVAEIEEIEGIYFGLSRDDRREIERFSESRTPENCPPPRTQRELEEAERVLSAQKGYDLVRLHQKRPVSLKQS